MTRTEPGRLYRTTRDWTTEPLFYLYADDRPTRYDDTIGSVTIRRGLGEPGGGVAISTMEVVVPEMLPYPTMTGRSIGFNMLGSTAEQLAARTGYPGDPLELQARFKGRIGPVEVTDTGKARTSSTRLACSSWIALENGSNHTVTIPQYTYVDEAIRQLLYRAPSKYTMTDAGEWDSLNVAIPDASYSDTIAKLTSDYEVLVADRRNGNMHAMSLPYRWAQAQARVATTAHLTRSQAISPAKWLQQSEASARKYKFEMTNAAGNRHTTTRFLEEQVTPDAEIVDVDWLRFTQLTDHWDYASRAIVHRDNIRAYNLPSVTVDLLHLLGSTNAYHRRQAGELLALETGDTLNLSGDWHPALQGIQIVTGMTETLTGDSWTLELALAPLIHVFGHYSPEIPALVWDAATYPWNTETRTWNLVGA